DERAHHELAVRAVLDNSRTRTRVDHPQQIDSPFSTLGTLGMHYNAVFQLLVQRDSERELQASTAQLWLTHTASFCPQQSHQIIHQHLRIGSALTARGKMAGQGEIRCAMGER